MAVDILKDVSRTVSFLILVFIFSTLYDRVMQIQEHSTTIFCEYLFKEANIAKNFLLLEYC